MTVTKRKDGKWEVRGVHPTYGMMTALFDKEPTSGEAADALNAEVRKQKEKWILIPSK